MKNVFAKCISVCLHVYSLREEKFTKEILLRRLYTAELRLL